jgi:hypothetical protein
MAVVALIGRFQVSNFPGLRPWLLNLGRHDIRTVGNITG